MTTTDLILPETLRADVVYAPGGVDGILERIEREVRAAPTDISTKPGRQAVAALAYRVARSKTALDDLGKGLVADIKGRAALIDDDRRRVRERLDGLRDEVRRPLTEWEDAEKSRVNAHEIALSGILIMAQFQTVEPTADEIAQRIVKLSEMPPREWHEFAKRGAEATAQVLASLRASHDAAVRREAERAELARLRREEEDRRKKDYEENLRRIAAKEARERAEAKAREAARLQAAMEAAERARVDRERVAAEEAKLEAMAAAERAEQRARDAKEQARRDAAAAERDRVIAAEKYERDRGVAEAKAKQDAVEAERVRVALEWAVEQDARKRREADKMHRKKINREVTDSLVAIGVLPSIAKTVVLLLADGKIPHTKISY